jgi:succinate dehydrogenase flavin-adding protein (antitoxin of CptAB toxin-antitoxin module)
MTLDRPGAELDSQSAEFARLRWRSRRGIRELDAVLQAFLQQSYVALSD